MHPILVSVIALLAIAVCTLGFFWLFRSEQIRRAAYIEKQAKFYR